MEKIAISLSNSWIPESYLHWIVEGTPGTMLSTILMYRCIFRLFLYSSSIEEISNKFFGGSQSHSSDNRIFWHSWSSSSVGGWVTSPQVDTSIVIGMNRFSDDSIPSFLCGLVWSLHIWIPNFRHWFGFISDFPSYFQTTRIVQTPVLPTALNQVSKK